jgi:hypothetical protein
MTILAEGDEEDQSGPSRTAVQNVFENQSVTTTRTTSSSTAPKTAKGTQKKRSKKPTTLIPTSVLSVKRKRLQNDALQLAKRLRGGDWDRATSFLQSSEPTERAHEDADADATDGKEEDPGLSVLATLLFGERKDMLSIIQNDGMGVLVDLRIAEMVFVIRKRTLLC